MWTKKDSQKRCSGQYFCNQILWRTWAWFMYLKFHLSLILFCNKYTISRQKAESCPPEKVSNKLEYECKSFFFCAFCPTQFAICKTFVLLYFIKLTSRWTKKRCTRSNFSWYKRAQIHSEWTIFLFRQSFSYWPTVSIPFNLTKERRKLLAYTLLMQKRSFWSKTVSFARKTSGNQDPYIFVLANKQSELCSLKNFQFGIESLAIKTLGFVLAMHVLYCIQFLYCYLALNHTNGNFSFNGFHLGSILSINEHKQVLVFFSIIW